MIFDSAKAPTRQNKVRNTKLGALYPTEPERIGIPRDVLESGQRVQRISDRQVPDRDSQSEMFTQKPIATTKGFEYGVAKTPYELKEVYAPLKDRQRRNLGTIAGPKNIAQLVVNLSEKWDDVEHFIVFHLSRPNEVMSYHIIGKGVIDAVLAHPREIFKTAIMQGASSIIVAHNHPSGNIQPSEEDRNITKRIVQSGRVLDIRLLDHVVVGTKDVEPARFYSLWENENHLFS
ncbi:MAG: hypothetical protein FGM22_07295 [Burkholderiaceae bacterium]|nr:hypothetical protein [Burkholderiaceae bacterium]